jgi:hypothetical protein
MKRRLHREKNAEAFDRFDWIDWTIWSTIQTKERERGTEWKETKTKDEDDDLSGFAYWADVTKTDQKSTARIDQGQAEWPVLCACVLFAFKVKRKSNESESVNGRLLARQTNQTNFTFNYVREIIQSKSAIDREREREGERKSDVKQAKQFGTIKRNLNHFFFIRQPEVTMHRN